MARSERRRRLSRSTARARIGIDGVREIDDTFTAQAFIITDLDDNQITAFHPGAMNHAHVSSVGDVGGIGLGIVAPDGKEGMARTREQFAAAGIPFIFDPGRGCRCSAAASFSR
jgi:adenosine kinase